MLPVLAIAAATVGSLAVARALEAFGHSDPDGDGRLPASWGPGEAPAKPWAADRENPNGAKLGCASWKGQNSNAVFARWLNHEKGFPLPGNVQLMSNKQLAAWLSTANAQHAGNSKWIAAAAEWDAIAIGCMGEAAWRGIKAAPGRAWDWGKRTAEDGLGWSPADGISADAGNGNSIDVDDDGGSVTVGGHKLASW